jgi:hypothetical protein
MMTFLCVCVCRACARIRRTGSLTTREAGGTARRRTCTRSVWCPASLTCTASPTPPTTCASASQSASRVSCMHVTTNKMACLLVMLLLHFLCVTALNFTVHYACIIMHCVALMQQTVICSCVCTSDLYFPH